MSKHSPEWLAFRCSGVFPPCLPDLGVPAERALSFNNMALSLLLVFTYLHYDLKLGKCFLFSEPGFPKLKP